MGDDLHIGNNSTSIAVYITQRRKRVIQYAESRIIYWLHRKLSNINYYYCQEALDSVLSAALVRKAKKHGNCEHIYH